MSRVLNPRFALFALAPTVAAAMCVYFGVELGRHLALRGAARAAAANRSNATLGEVVDAAAALAHAGETGRSARQDFALAYLDPERAARELGDYSFSPPMVPTPFVGYAPLPGRHANATINAQQLRHDRDLAVPKPTGLVRVFVTGGSTAFGAGAPGGAETITGYLAAILEERITSATGVHYEVVNAAAPAWASTQERILIENRLSELEPDLVVSFSGTNDAHWGALGRDVLWFRAYEDQHYFDLQNLLRDELGLERYPDVARGRAPRRPPAAVAASAVKNVTLAANALALRAVPYVFVLQPVLATTKKVLTPRERQRKAFSLLGPDTNTYFEQSFDSMRERLSSLELGGYVFVDLTGVFDDVDPQAEIFLDAYHFGDRGNELIARALFRELAPLLQRE